MRWFNLNTGKIILVIIIIPFAIGMGIVGYSLWNVPKAKELFPFLEISEAFPTKVIALFTALLAGATLLLAIAAFGSIWQNYLLQKRDRKERLLKEIIEWATEIHTASLKTDLPKIDPSLELYIEEKAEGNQERIEGIKRNIVNKEHYRIEVETLFKYSIPYSRAEYIRALASGNFGGHGITKIVDDIIDNLGALLFLSSMKIGIDNLREGFGESAIINRVEEELKNPVNTIDNSFKKYAKELSASVNALFTDAAKFISNL